MSEPFKDLELEFEDEDGPKTKKEAVTHVSLEFKGLDKTGVTQSQISSATNAASPAAPKTPTTQPKTLPQAPTSRPAIKAVPGAARPTQLQVPKASVATATVTQNPAELKVANITDVDDLEVAELRERLKTVEFDSSVKVAIAEYKTEILAELYGDIKLLEHQIGQLLVRINTKHPDIKQEALMIKKLLADFSAKKRK